jgi:hypothetical protein
MSDREEPPEEGVRTEKAAGETGRAAKDRARREEYLARERAIEEAANARAAQRAEKRATEEIAQSAKHLARRKAFLARELAMVMASSAWRCP